MTAPISRILIADDQQDVVEALRLLLKPEGYQIDTADSPAGGPEGRRAPRVRRRPHRLELRARHDVRPGGPGSAGAASQTMDEALPVVVMTAWASVSLAVEAMRRGARDFIEKPWNNDRVLAILRTQVEFGRALRRTTRLEAQNRLQTEGCPPLIAPVGGDAACTRRRSRGSGPSEANVLITGENGTGKGLVAQAIHAASLAPAARWSRSTPAASRKACSKASCSATCRGAFTDARQDRIGRFEMADGGTLFLDEIANVPLSQQQKLLRVLERGEFERLGSSTTRKADVRLISATNADIDAEVDRGAVPAGPAVPAEHNRNTRCRRCATGARTFRRWRSTSSPFTRRATAKR